MRRSYADCERNGCESLGGKISGFKMFPRDALRDEHL